VRDEDLCSGPGKLTQALDIELDLNGTSLLGDGPIRIDPRPAGRDAPRVLTGTRIGITKAAELPWRFAEANSPYVSRPRLKAA
jgi:DNA-3-methyladenine glycosylase